MVLLYDDALLAKPGGRIRGASEIPSPLEGQCSLNSCVTEDYSADHDVRVGHP